MEPTNKKIIMLVMFPPPYSSGERIMNQINREILEKHYQVTSLNVSSGKLHPDRFTLSKITNQLTILWLYFRATATARKMVKKQDIHAFCISTPGSRYGHIRDAIILSIIGKYVKNNIAFIHNGHIDRVFKKTWHSYFTSNLISNTRSFVFTSSGLKDKATDIPEHKKKVLHNSIDPALVFTEPELENKRTRLIHNMPLRILYLSNMTPSKGFMDVAWSIKLLHQKGIQAEADFVGEWLSAEQLADFKNFITQNNLDNFIHIHGKLNDRSKVKLMYQDIHFFVLPTYFTHEAQPLSIIEALNAGVPVISTHHASIPEMITDGVNGRLVPPKDPEAIAEAIEKSMHTNIWLEMSKEARKTFDTLFGRETYEQKLLSLFQ